MDLSLVRGLGAALILGLLTGCSWHTSPANSAPADQPRPAGYEQHVRNNAASLLYDLLSDEKNLGKILIVKHASDDVSRLVKTISTAAGDGAAWLEQVAKTNRPLNIHVLGLPSGEVATRKAIAKTKERELLHATGAEFELQLLLTQVEALNYGTHLAAVASENEPRPEIARGFSALGDRLRDLHAQVLALVRQRR
jgi:hypothetical protein